MIKTAVRVVSVVVAIALLQQMAVCTGKARMIDPLIAAGMTKEQVRRYLYLFALKNLSLFSDAYPSKDKGEALAFLEGAHAVSCPLCHRWYFEGVMFCRIDGRATVRVDDDVIYNKIEAWEGFRRRYTETTRIKGLTRTTTIKLHYVIEHPGER